MGVRRGSSVELTIGCAMIGRHLANVDDYLAEKAAVESVALELAHEHGFAECVVGINAADNLKEGSLYLTVTGTSAEAGDDGQVGRGNRANGLITPGRAMSLEAVAGKNPVSHVGKLYNVLARQIAEAVVSEIAGIDAAECMLVSRIGRPVAEPALMQVKVRTRDGGLADRFRPQVAGIAADQLARAETLIEGFVAGTVPLF